jgi:hypothetical protein
MFAFLKTENFLATSPRFSLGEGINEETYHANESKKFSGPHCFNDGDRYFKGKKYL